MDAAVIDRVFEQSFSVTRRVAAVRAAMIAAVHRLPADSCRDLEQEALLELWKNRHAYDPQRGSWRTFSEKVVANRMSSLVRKMHSRRSGQFKEEPLENFPELAESHDRGYQTALELRADVKRVLSELGCGDQRLAQLLFVYTPSEVSRILRISRSSFYGRIRRIQVAFVRAGYGPRRAFQPDSAKRPGM